MVITVDYCERDSRDSYSASYKITGPSQRGPSNWTSALKNNSDDFARIYQIKPLIANLSNVCYRYRAVDGIVLYWNVEVTLYSDMKRQIVGCFIIWRMYVAQTTLLSEQMILIVLLSHSVPNPLLMQQLSYGSNSDYKQTTHKGNVKQLHATLGEPLCNPLPAYHTFTGYDYTTSFS